MGFQIAGLTGTLAQVNSSNELLVAGSFTVAPDTAFLLSDGTNNMGLMSVFGTSPGAVYALNANVSLFAGVTGLTATGTSLDVSVTNTVPVTGTFWQATQPVSGTVTIGAGSASIGTVVLGAGSASVGTVVLGAGAAAIGSVSVSGSVAVTGTFWQATQPVSIASTVGVTQSTSPWVNNLTQWASTALGTPTNFGTTPGAVIAASANVSLFAGTTALSQTGGSLNVNITGGGGGGGGTQYVDGTAESAGGFTGTVAMSYNGTDVVGLRSDASDNLLVKVNVALPAGTNVIGHVITDSGSTTAVTGTVAVTQSTSPWVVSLTSTTITGTVAVTQSTSPWVTQDEASVAQGSTTSGQDGILIQGAVTTAAPTYTTAKTNPLSLTTAGALRVDGSGVTQPVSGTLAISGTVAVTQSTSPWVVSLTSTTITGSVAVTGTFWQATQPVSDVNLELAQGSTTSGQVGPLMQGAVTTSAPTYTTGKTDPFSLTTAGALRVDGSGVTQPVSIAGTVAVSGTVTANAGTGTFNIQSNASVNLNEYAGTALTGTVTAYGTAPTGNVFGVNAYVTNTVAVSQSGTWNIGTVTTVSTVTAVTAITNALPAGTNLLGSVNIAPATSGGCSTAVSQALTTTINVKASAGQLYGYTLSNPNASVVYVTFYNTATTPGTIGATTNLVLEIMIPAGSTANVSFPDSAAIAFSSGIAIAVATTATGNTAPATGITTTTIYK